MTVSIPARIHLLPARGAPVVAILRRKPSAWFHVLKWDTARDRIEPGSWFRGRLFPTRCDLSFDGEWLVYMALGSRGDTWAGISRLPWLKTVTDGSTHGTWTGGGYWERPTLLKLYGWEPAASPAEKLPFELETFDEWGKGLLVRRLERDGWRQSGGPGPEDGSWFWKPSVRHPTLWLGPRFAFSLDEHPGLLEGVDWATWDFSGNLVVARRGGVERYTLEGLASGRPDFARSFEDLAPPVTNPSPARP